VTRDLLITPHTPALGNGRSMRTYALARALALIGRGPDVLYVRFGPSEPDTAFTTINGIRFFEVVPSRGLTRLLAYCQARVWGVPAAFARGLSAELTSSIARLTARTSGRVIADGPVAATATRRLPGERPAVYAAQNLETAFRAELDNRRARAFERRLLSDACEVWLPSEREVRAASELCPEGRYRYVPNAVDVAAIEPVTRRRDEKRVLVVGDFSYEPNRRALRFLLVDVLPQLRKLEPAARLAVAGKHAAELLPADDHIEHLGFVPRLAEAYAGADCVAVPLLDGGGTPLKFIEAMAYGVPVVATAVAARGLSVRPERHYIEADGGPAFAAAIARVLEGGAPGLAAEARALVESMYSIEALSRCLEP